MKWNHLPVDGGIYDQHPELLEDFVTLFSIEAKEKKREFEKQRRQAKVRRK